MRAWWSAGPTGPALLFVLLLASHAHAQTPPDVSGAWAPYRGGRGADPKLNPPPPDPMQAKVFQFMPIIFTVFFLFFPAGLVLYWLVNNVLSIAQQWVITRQIEKAA